MLSLNHLTLGDCLAHHSQNVRRATLNLLHELRAAISKPSQPQTTFKELATKRLCCKSADCLEDASTVIADNYGQRYAVCERCADIHNRRNATIE